MSKARDIASAAPAPSTVSTTELGYLDGVTSAIQTQLDAKTAKSTLTTTGDIYYASSANTPARLAIGSTSDVLTVVDGVPSWAAPSSGGMTLLSTTTLSGSSTTITTDFTGYVNAYISFENIDLSANDGFWIRPNGSSTGVFMTLAYQDGGSATLSFENDTELQFNFGDNVSGSSTVNNALLEINNPASTSTWKSFNYNSVWEASDGGKNSFSGGGGIATISAITSIGCVPYTGGTTFQGGTVKVYGVK
jgi:hypothetical protein